MKLKNVLCMAVVSAAVALAGVPVNGTTLTVHAEETQISNLDDILRQMYALYVNGDYASMYALDVSDAVVSCVETIMNSGSDRYVIDLDGSTKAMIYVSENGGYWWYFGQMENSLRQGNGTTIILGADDTQLYTGIYHDDFPGGEGKMTQIFNDDGATFDISGNFQGTFLNGAYQVNVNWFDSDEGMSHTSSKSITYVNSHFQSVGGYNFNLYPYADDGFTEYNIWDDYNDIYIYIENEYELFAVGFDEYNYYYWAKTPESIAAGFSLFQGNAAASNTPASEVTTPEADVPEVPSTPVPEVTEPTPAVPQPSAVPGTYVVERGDNLSRIAQKVYGDRKLWRKIYEANSDVIKSDYIILVNQVLTIPQL